MKCVLGSNLFADMGCSAPNSSMELGPNLRSRSTRRSRSRSKSKSKSRIRIRSRSRIRIRSRIRSRSSKLEQDLRSSLTEVETGTDTLLLEAWQVKMECKSDRWRVPS